ncbi:helix-turn-helix domain-containing protein [Streptomyces bambusae]|uniref:helix-turn-helix domain-containing protein n=1 Tax=Streptomyces bambusae TaxID=1550616 RepID=UPI001CFCA0FE|nr:helix-turn-helix domain-containing protein [Streptomyces bambusae]MCB5168810.1 helix-turn-helix domain-containing protein [Streptomyces bambusae]
MSLVTTTAAVSATERTDYWHSLVSGTFIPLDVTLHEPEPAVGTIVSEQVGRLQISEVGAGPQTVVRSPRRIAQGGGQFVTLTLQHAGTARLTQHGRQALVVPGTFTCSDAGQPYRREQPDGFRFTAFRVPKADIGVSDDDLRSVTGTLFDGRSGTAGVLAGYLAGLAGQASGLDPDTGHRLALTAADLLAVLVRERQGRLDPQAPEAAGGTLARVKAYARRHLADPGLTPQRIAAAHHVSVRYLHRLFQAQGTSVGRWIRQERLDRCRRDLACRAGTTTAVSAVAQRWGFVSPAHFSRAFRAAYGMSPREWQAASRADGGRA